MRTKEIIEKAGLQNGFDKKNQEKFFQMLTDELHVVYDSFGVKDSERHFVAAVKILRSKWDAVAAKIPYGIPEGAWGFFYAKNVGPLKDALCPTWKKINDAWIAKKNKRKEEYYGEKKNN